MSRLIVAIVGVVACSGCAHLRPQKSPIPYEFFYGGQGQSVVGPSSSPLPGQSIQFLQDLQIALQRTSGLAWSGATRQPPTGPLNRDALLIYLKSSWWVGENGNVAR